MKPNKVSITIISIPDCPACDKLKIIVKDLLANNEFLAHHVTGVSIQNLRNGTNEYTEFPIFQIYNNETRKLVYEAIGCYGQATIMWKLIKWIVPNGE